MKFTRGVVDKTVMKLDSVVVEGRPYVDCPEDKTKNTTGYIRSVSRISLENFYISNNTVRVNSLSKQRVT